jgi:hypothetical protein
MATGIWSAPVRPRLPGEERFAGLILHSRDYRNPHIFRGQRVLVVGAGNSGAEIAVDLAGHGVETAIVVRSGVAFVPRPRSAAGMRLAAWLLRTLPPWLACRAGSAATAGRRIRTAWGCHISVLPIEPLRGSPNVRVTERRTRCDFAEQLRLLSDEDYPQAERIVLVVDRLNTHGPGTLYEAFATGRSPSPGSAFRMAWHARTRQLPQYRRNANSRFCTGSAVRTDSIPDMSTLHREVAAWDERRNKACRPVMWHRYRRCCRASNSGVWIRL